MSLEGTGIFLGVRGCMLLFKLEIRLLAVEPRFPAMAPGHSMITKKVCYPLDNSIPTSYIKTSKSTISTNAPIA